MAKHILAKGHKLVGCNRSRGPVDEIVKAGGIAADTPSDVARQATIVITMVPDTPDVEQVLTGPNGVLSALQRGSVVIDMSSISPVATRRLAAEVVKHGGTMLDAPVSGGEVGAINATLSIMIGGDADAVKRVRPILECMGNPERIVHIGSEPGSGQVCKVCNQMAIGGALIGVSEAFAIAQKAGVDLGRVREALLGGFASSRVLEVHGERILKGNFKPGFKTKLFAKDLKIAASTLVEQAVAAPITAVAQQEINARMAAGAAEEDYSGMAKVILDLARLD
jgi:2-hydroxy-3-oxopropionate reductase